jgi:peptide deformylase
MKTIIDWFVLVFCCIFFLPLLGDEKMTNSERVKNEPPQYLYKILTLRNWQETQSKNVVAKSAEDALFIHLSTESQLEKILKKYWADAQQLVILKIDTSKLEGKLVYEPNPGKTTQYYHLYYGCVPFSSIVESKTIYRSKPDSCDSDKLDIVQVGDAVLRKPARELSRDEILSQEIQELIKKMKTTMRASSGVGLAAPQVGKSIQLAVIEDVDHSHLTAEQLAERNRSVVPFHVIINPRIFIDEKSEKAEFFEGCLSVPQFLGIVPRATSVRVECLNEHAQRITIHAKGWYARILQHEIDHLMGTLFIDRAPLPTLITEESYVKLWKNKSIQEIQSNLIYKKKAEKAAKIL